MDSFRDENNCVKFKDENNRDISPVDSALNSDEKSVEIEPINLRIGKSDVDETSEEEVLKVYCDRLLLLKISQLSFLSLYSRT